MKKSLTLILVYALLIHTLSSCKKDDAKLPGDNEVLVTVTCDYCYVTTGTERNDTRYVDPIKGGASSKSDFTHVFEKNQWINAIYVQVLANGDQNIKVSIKDNTGNNKYMDRYVLSGKTVELTLHLN